MRRTVEPEWLDDFSPDDPQAIRSRRDLQRLNVLMGHAGIVAKNLAKIFSKRKPKRIVELGAGDGTFLLRVARRLEKNFRDVEVRLIDRQNLLSAKTKREFAELGWKADAISADVFDWLARCEPCDGIVANLFLHHFSTPFKVGRVTPCAPGTQISKSGAHGATRPTLEELFRLAAMQTDAFIACEPRRAAFPLLASRSLGLIGCNAVTRHDAPISVRAGFRDDELSRLWPKGDWSLHEESAGLFSHLFVAENLARLTASHDQWPTANGQKKNCQSAIRNPQSAI